MRKGNETGMRGASEYGNSTITNYRHKENLNISYNEEKTFSFMLYRTMLFLSLRVYTFAFIIHPLLFARFRKHKLNGRMYYDDEAGIFVNFHTDGSAEVFYPNGAMAIKLQRPQNRKCNYRSKVSTCFDWNR